MEEVGVRMCRGASTPPRHGIQRDRVGKRAVRVLLECLLVKNTSIYVTFVCVHVRVIGPIIQPVTFMPKLNNSGVNGQNG